MKRNHFILLILLCLAAVRSNAQNAVVINKYAEVFSYQSCSNSLLVDSSTGFAAGDTILMIQMKGAIIDTSNTAAFGNVLSYGSAGNYEYNIVKAVSGNSIQLTYVITHTYDYAIGRVQLVRVPGYQNYQVNQPHTCMPWNGHKGGVFALFVANTLTLNSNIDVSGSGFAGGKNNQNATVVVPAVCLPNENAYYRTPDFDSGSMKGEGIAEISQDKSFGRGKLANGGGGGCSHNAGGGGGSNAGIGGLGGSEYAGCNPNPQNNDKGGIGGASLAYINTADKIFLGGGGGSAQTNNLSLANGGNGGGICIINAGTIVGNSKTIKANGRDGLQCINNGTYGSCHDGMAGGGGGGVLLLNIDNYSGNLGLEAKGGKGADETGNAGYFQVGPGGGAGGGCIWIKNTALPSSATPALSGGVNGVVVYNGSNWGAQPGLQGTLLTGLSIPFPSDTFVNTTLTVDFTKVQLDCFSFSFTGMATANGSGTASLLWDFGDGTTSLLQNPVHAYTAYGSYNVSLTLSASAGCQNTVVKNVAIQYFPFAHATGDTILCKNSPLQLNATGGSSYQWTPVTGLDNANISDPIATVTTPTLYTVTVTDTFGCVDKDSVYVNLFSAPEVSATSSSAIICGSGSVQLNVTGLSDPEWTPGNSLDNAFSLHPVASPLSTVTYMVSGADQAGCPGKDSVTISVFSLPDVTARAENDSLSCQQPEVRLYASGGITYSWTPAERLANPFVSDPVANLQQNTMFRVTGTDMNGCKNADSVFVTLYDNKTLFVPTAFSPNGDGANDVFLPRYRCDMTLLSFNVYNRFGQRVFSTNSQQSGWDGLQNGRPAEVGIYFWIISGHDLEHNPVERRGDLTLVR